MAKLYLNKLGSNFVPHHLKCVRQYPALNREREVQTTAQLNAQKPSCNYILQHKRGSVFRASRLTLTFTFPISIKAAKPHGPQQSVASCPPLPNPQLSCSTTHAASTRPAVAYVLSGFPTPSDPAALPDAQEQRSALTLLVPALPPLTLLYAPLPKIP